MWVIRVDRGLFSLIELTKLKVTTLVMLIVTGGRQCHSLEEVMWLDIL